MSKRKRQPIKFVNVEGKEIQIDPKLTIGDLLKMGIRFVGLSPENAPPDPNPNIYQSTK
jgi:hypothetical protein